MRNEDQKPQVASTAASMPRSGRTNGFIPTSFRAFSRIVSSGASTVASTVRSAASAASAIVERENDAYHDQVFWAGFDKLECEGGSTRRILLLGYRFGFQIWDVEEANNVRELTSRYDGHVSFMQILPEPLASMQSDDRFADNRPLLVVCADGSFSGGGGYVQDGLAIPSNGNPQNYIEPLNSGFVPTAVWFYSLKSHSYARVLKFRSAVYSVRCSSRIVAVLQAAQIHCFDAATLEREYTILTNPIVTSPGSVTIGLGPLAVGPRWIAYSGSPIPVSNSGRVSPQHLMPSASFPNPTSNGSLVAHYAKESSKQLAAGIVTLGDIGYKKLSRYYSEILPDGNSTLQLGGNLPGWKDRAVGNAAHLPDTDNLGMVVIRDVVSKSVVAQFRAHKSPISSLCFDPSGTLLVTASVQGHNINVFRIMPGLSGSSSAHSDSGPSYVQLYSLQRGFTNAVIQDISFSDDSHWIMISSTRTSHLFAISPLGSDTCFTTRNGFNPQYASSYPITLSAVSRIRSGNSGWRSTVTGAAAAATGKVSSFSGAIASTFHNCKGKDLYVADSSSSSMAKYNLLVFSHPGCVIQYALRTTTSGSDSGMSGGLSNACELAPVVVEAIQKWNIFQKQNKREQREENMDIYGENGNQDSSKIFPEGGKKEKSTVYPEAGAMVTKVKMSSDDKHHMFISEAELQMHEPRFLLWAKPEIYFQSMIKDDIEIDEENALGGGEIEIERIPVRMIEPRSKDLVPVLPYFQAPLFQQPRVAGLDSHNLVQTLHRRSGSSENGRLSRWSSNGSLDSMTDRGVAVTETHAGNENSKGYYVYKNDSPKLNTRLDNVNNNEKEGSTQSKFVNNNNVGLKMETQSEDEGDDDELD